MNSSKTFIFDEKTALPGLAGKFGIVTGSSRGMGLVMAKLLIECGANVVINGRNSDEIAEVVREMNALRAGAAIGFSGDTADLSQVQMLFKTCCEWSKGRVDFLINNAGFPLDDTLWETPLHKFDDEQIQHGFAVVSQIDLAGARFCSREALRRMVKQKSGSIVFISSTPALTGYHGTPYTEAKAAILGLMRDIAHEYAASQIRANALALGNISSGWYHQLNDDEKGELARESPANRWGKQREVAGAAAFLISDLAGYINGQTIVVDGGKVIR